jgi:hypothetical protein
VLRKLDYLLEKFLLFASKEMQFRSHLRAVLAEVRGVKPRAQTKDDARSESRPSDDRPQRRTITNAPRQPSAPQRADDAPPDAADRWVQQTVGEAQANYELEMNDIRKLLEKEQDADTKAVLEKRLDVLQRRHEFVGKIGKTLLNLNHQLELLEDTFGLISDEIRARSPEQILADIEDVVGQTDTMTRVLEEVAPYEQLAARMERTKA